MICKVHVYVYKLGLAGQFVRENILSFEVHGLIPYYV